MHNINSDIYSYKYFRSFHTQVYTSNAATVNIGYNYFYTVIQTCYDNCFSKKQTIRLLTFQYAIHNFPYILNVKGGNLYQYKIQVSVF